MPALVSHVVESGSELASLLPVRIGFWLKVLEAVYEMPPARSLRSSLQDFLAATGEYSHVTVDGTVRVLRRVRGQQDYRCGPEARNSAPIPDTHAKRRVLTILGRSSAPLAFALLPDEGASSVTDAFKQAFTSAQRELVRSVCVDCPSGHLRESLAAVLPNLTILSLDPVHICMVYEQCHFKKSTEGSAMHDVARFKAGLHNVDWHHPLIGMQIGSRSK
jgi:hypothetical protein